ncbi:MAG: flavoprotein [Promethearchaeota archaeon]
MFKLLWGITGSGYLIKESIDLMKNLQENNDIKITVILSQEGAVVVKWYQQWLYLKEIITNVKIEKTPNNPWIAGPLQIGKYDFFIICPVTANTVAKIAHGVADNLISNCVAQAIKGGMQVHLLPSDQEEMPIITHRPDGSELILKIRDVEMENVNKLKIMQGINVISDFNDIKRIIAKLISQKQKKS